MTYRDALAWGIAQLRTHDCDGSARNAAQEADWLLRHAAKKSREQMLAALAAALPAAAERRYRALIAKRRAHTPLAWLLGTAWFMDREFTVTPDTLIPRTATESVVTAAVNAARTNGCDIAVDVGTGSGCIAITLAHELPDARVFATDGSIPALAMARRNAKAHGVFKHITLRKTNLLGYAPTPGHASTRPLPIPAVATPLIVANLPYIPTSDRAKLSRCVRREPASALFSGRDGLDASRALLAQVAKMPNKRIVLVYEILPRQFSPLAAAVRRAFPGTVPTRIANPAGITVGLLASITK